jgi:hypothetical protein
MRLFGALAAATFLALVHPSPAHESWISQKGATNPVTGNWCCGMRDCGIVMPAPVATAAGWAIHGDEIIDHDGRRVRVDEVVPYDEATPSPDGYFWRCHTLEGTFYDVENHVTYADGSRRCFFAPPQSL